jgi:hypothetical protein
MLAEAILNASTAAAGDAAAVRIGINPIVTSEKQRLNMIGNLV